MNKEMFQEELAAIAQKGNLRTLPEVIHNGKLITTTEGGTMLNLSSNDYLGLASNDAFLEEFMNANKGSRFCFSSSSARLLTGNYTINSQLEKQLANDYEAEAALLLNSGYHANTGILAAITTDKSLILADKLVHASLIDGMQLAPAKKLRYKHNDYAQLERLLATHAHLHDRVVVVTESIFSMDGDCASLPRLVALKKEYPHLMLYLDEAHAVGVRGEKGLGCAEEEGVLADIDILVGTFGKALASVGAYVICSAQLKAWLVNRMRTFIFTTALPPINVKWSLYVMQHLATFQAERFHLSALGSKLRSALATQEDMPSSSHIVPLVAGESERAIQLAKTMQRKGYYLLPVRPPTVPEGSSRLRISLTANITTEEMSQFIETLQQLNV